MKQVDFYLLSNAVNQGKFKLAGRLANKLQSLAKKTLIVTDTEEQLNDLDAVLWSFSDTSFVAHHQPSGESALLSKTHISTAAMVDQEALQHDYNVLISLSEDIPVFSHHFSRIAEIIDANDDAKSAARARYRRYQSEGFELKTHQIEL